MYGYMLQDWTTIQGGAISTVVTQAEAEWLDLARFQDVFFYVEVRSLVKAGATNIQLTFETAPTKDATSFTAMVAALNLPAASTTPSYVPVLASSASLSSFPALTRYVRWTLQANGGTLTGNWSATFRVTCAANSILGG
jgi:hypothetical protein